MWLKRPLRGNRFEEIERETVRALKDIPTNFSVCFMTGGNVGTSALGSGDYFDGGDVDFDNNYII